MRVIKIYNFPLLPRAYSAITLYPFICFSAGPADVHKHTYKHEMIHVAQIRRVGFFSFYISYLLYFLAGLIESKQWDEAYMTIPYEIEAFAYQDSPLTMDEIAELRLVTI